jgi:hypothetical protein
MSEATNLDELPVEIARWYTDLRRLEDGRWIGVHRLLYHWTLHVGIDLWGYEDRWCFATRELAVAAMGAYQPGVEPVGWHRHPMSGRRRRIGPDGVAVLAEWGDHEMEPRM